MYGKKKINKYSYSYSYSIVFVLSPATWKSWMKGLKAFELKTPFSHQPGIYESCCKDPLGLCINLLLCTVFHLPNRGREAAIGGHAEVGGGGCWGRWGGTAGPYDCCQVKGVCREGYFLLPFNE
jgi:hypothetical protein